MAVDDVMVRLKLIELGKVFRPAGPIDVEDLFQGRGDQLLRLHSAINETGRHAVVYGERGVGKTSLVAVSSVLAGPQVLSLRINCDTSDNFASLASKIIERLTVVAESARHDAEQLVPQIERAIELLNYEEPSPSRMDLAFGIIATVAPVLIFLDEFDRVHEPGTRVLITDTIKTLSDQLTRATLVLVGVADDIEGLVANHASIVRSIAQIRMPRMEPPEIRQIVDNGFGRLEISCSEEAMHLLIHLPQGLPAYAHQLAQAAARNAIIGQRDVVDIEDVRSAMMDAINTADESTTRAYVDAVASSHRNLYGNLLLACALAPVDAKGCFAPGDLREPLRLITSEDFTIDRFQRQLVRLCEDRGPVLERRGGDRHWRYRFIDPIMRPYIIMRAYSDGVSLEALSLVLPPATGSGQLFELDSLAPPD